MRFYKKNEVILSEDTTNDPKDIRFQKTDDITDITSVIDGGGATKTYDTGTHSVAFGAISTVKWFYIYADKAIKIKLDSGPDIQLIAEKPAEMWAEVAAIDLVVDTADTRITVAIAGD